MDKKQLIAIINEVVKIRINKLLKSDKFIQNYIKEEVKNQLIKVLLENKIVTNQNKAVKKHSDLIDLIEESDIEDNYPKIEKTRTSNQSKPKIRYSKDPVLNSLLNETPYVNDDYGGMTGNALMDMGSFSNESVSFAQNYAQNLGKNVKIDINPDALENVKNTVPQNAKFVTSKKTPQLKEYKGDDGMMYVDDRELFAGDEMLSPQEVNIARSQQALENAFNKDYRGILNNWDKKISQKRKAYL